jgi:hypothetical protein
VCCVIHTATVNLLWTRVRRFMIELGCGINIALRRRKLTAAMMPERLGVGRQIYRRLEQGDPSAAMGTARMASLVLGLGWDGP